MYVRRAALEDIDDLVRLNDTVQRIHVQSRPDVFRLVETELVAAWFDERLRQPHVKVWLAVADDRLIGYALSVLHARPAHVFAHALRWVEIDQIGVEPAHRRRGVARALLDHVAADARAMNVHELRLRTWGFNHDAQDAFRHLGFDVRMLELARSC